MLFFLRRLRRDFPTWERTTQIGFGMALALLALLLILFFVAPQEARQTLLIGIGALVVVTQGIILWGNRGMVTPLGKAQRAYLAGDYEVALATLLPLREGGDARTLALLGNTYRQLGRLDESAQVLSEAIDKTPDHHSLLYGLGRTLIVQGQYAEGAALVERALAAGSPTIVRFDWAEALYRAGRVDEALRGLDDAPTDEPHQALMAQWWRWQQGRGDAPTQATIRAGLAYWQEQADRYAQTAYGRAVAQDVAALQQL